MKNIMEKKRRERKISEGGREKNRRDWKIREGSVK